MSNPLARIYVNSQPASGNVLVRATGYCDIAPVSWVPGSPSVVSVDFDLTETYLNGTKDPVSMSIPWIENGGLGPSVPFSVEAVFDAIQGNSTTYYLRGVAREEYGQAFCHGTLTAQFWETLLQ
jgi:hypothetical protein